MKVAGSGILLVGGEAFRWRPWLREGEKVAELTSDTPDDNRDLTGRLQNSKGLFDVPEQAWGILDLIYPKPGTYTYPQNGGHIWKGG
jgi:hypothetical protein